MHGLPYRLSLASLLVNFQVCLVLADEVACCAISLNFTKIFSRNMEGMGRNSFMPLKKV
jgi:hypothetical protein